MEIFKNMKKERKKELLRMIFFSILLIFITYVYKKNGKNFFVILSFLMLYLAVGMEVFLRAIYASSEKNFLDENFLITLSSFLAFFIGFFTEACLIMLLFALGKFFEKLSIDKIRYNFNRLCDIVPKNVNKVLENGKIVKISPKNIKKGDILLAKEGEKIPVCGSIIDGEGLLDNSNLSGNPMPVSVKSDDEILSTSTLKTGQIKYRAKENFDQSLGKEIINLISISSKKKSQSEKIMRDFAKIFSASMLAMAIFIALVPWILGGDFNKYLEKSLNFLIISSPFAFIFTISLPYACGLILSNKNKILVKDAKSFEKLIDCDYFYTEMTGILTTGEFELKDIIYYGSYNKNLILDYLYNLEKLSDNKISKSIVNRLKRRDNPSYFIGSKNINGIDIWAKTYDNEEIKIGRKSFVNIDDASLDKAIYMTINDNLVCKIIFDDFLKDDTEESIEFLKNEFSDLVIISPHKENEVKNLAEKLLISYAYDLSVEDKLYLIEDERKNGHKIVFVGNGYKDGEILKASDLGISLGEVKSKFESKNSDIVIFDKKYEKIKDLMEISKIVDKNAKKNLLLVLFTKILIVILTLIGLCSIWLSIALDIGILIFSIISTINIIKKKI